MPVAGEELDPDAGGKRREFVGGGGERCRRMLFDEGEEGTEVGKEEREI